MPNHRKVSKLSLAFRDLTKLAPSMSERNGTMASLAEVIQQVYKVRDSLEAKEPVTAWKHTLPIQQFGIDTALQFGLKSENGGYSKEECKELKKAVKGCSASLKKLTAKNSVQKIGDGKLLDKLKKILDLVITLLPIFLEEPNGQAKKAKKASS